MKNFLSKIFLLAFAVCFVLAGSISPAEALVVKGLAPIVNGDIATAKKEARRQAMREAVESAAGVHVQSETEVANFMVVKDEISIKSDGYVTVNKIISEGPKGDIYYMELDVTASTEKIRQFAQDIKSQLDANVNDSNARGGIITAVVQKNPDGPYSYDTEMGTYLDAKLRFAGFKASPNDNVSNYLLSHASDSDVSLKARVVARENRESQNALMRGVLEIESVEKSGNFYEAVVKTSFELIGIDSSEVDAFTKYVKGVGNTKNEAIENAKEAATREAMETLAKQALETVQNETRGGTVNIKTMIVINNVTNYQAQYPLIKAGLEKIRCKILRKGSPDPTTITLYVSSDSHGSVDELGVALEDAIQGIRKIDQPSGQLGATKLYFTF